MSEHLVNMPLVEAENEVQGVGVTELAENRISVCIRKIDMIPGRKTRHYAAGSKIRKKGAIGMESGSSRCRVTDARSQGSREAAHANKGPLIFLTSDV